jgi:hypothetical protein
MTMKVYVTPYGRDLSRLTSLQKFNAFFRLRGCPIVPN